MELLLLSQDISNYIWLTLSVFQCKYICIYIYVFKLNFLGENKQLISFVLWDQILRLVKDDGSLFASSIKKDSPTFILYRQSMMNIKIVSGVYEEF